MTDDLAARIDHWVRVFQKDPASADEIAEVLSRLIDPEAGNPLNAVPILMMALGKYQDLSPAPDA